MKSESHRPSAVAFTLVELLGVIAIIGILPALLLPALARAKEKAKAVRVRAELYGIGLALEMYDMDSRRPSKRYVDWVVLAVRFNSDSGPEPPESHRAR